MGYPDIRGGNAQPVYEHRRRPETLTAVRDFLDAQPDMNILLSSEWFLADAQLVQRSVDALAADGRQVRVVAYVREQREWLVSRYAQAVKSRRWSLPLEQYVQNTYETPGLNYAKVFRELSESDRQGPSRGAPLRPQGASRGRRGDRHIRLD